MGGYSSPVVSVNSVKSVGGLAEGGVGGVSKLPPNLWASVKSVRENPLPEASVNSVNSVGELMLVHLRQVHPLRGWRGYGRDAIPSYENSHRLHGCEQIRKQKRSLTICEHL